MFEQLLSDLSKAFTVGLPTRGACVATGEAALSTVRQYLGAPWRRDRRDCTYVDRRQPAVNLTKPIDQLALVAVKSALSLKVVHDRVGAQAADLAAWNRELERRVEDQVRELERVGRLKRFLAPQIAELIVSGNEKFLESHRREITVVVCDLRGFTAFSETAAPEDVMVVLCEYQSALGTLVDKFEGTVERFTGDGLMVWFNDPLPCSDPCGRAARMGIEMRDCVSGLIAKWRKLDRDLGFAIGMAHGYATLGRIGFERRSDYAAVGMVVNLAARLCNEARDGQILVDSRVRAAVESFATVGPIGELALKGFNRPVKAFNLMCVQ
jgi:adenylate cyclase